MGRVATLQQQARARARRRRIALDYDRAGRDERVEASVAEVIVALGERDEALGQVQAVEGRAGEALRRIIAEGIKVEGVAMLCDLSAGEVRRLRRGAGAAREPRAIADPAGLGPAGVGPAGVGQAGVGPAGVGQGWPGPAGPGAGGGPGSR